MSTDTVRESTAADVQALGEIAEAAGLFPAEMLPDMMQPFLTDRRHRWLTSYSAHGPTGFCYLEPERLTEGTWNMLALAIKPGLQGQGRGRNLVAMAEELLRAEAARVLVVETAGADDYASARRFYGSQGYQAKGRLPDFYQDGVDKVIYWKRL